MSKFILLGLLLLANAAPAQTPAETPLQRTQALLGAVREEQQAVYQQFQMIQSLQQAEMQSPDPGSAAYAPPGQIPNYDDVSRARQEQQARLSNYSGELQQLHERYRYLGEEASRLVDRMRSLSQQGSR